MDGLTIGEDLAFHYKYAGLEICSSRSISGLVRSLEPLSCDGASIFITHNTGVTPKHDEIIVNFGGRYGTRLCKTNGSWLFDSKYDGAFLIDAKMSRIKIYSRTSPPSQICCDILTRRVLPRMMSARGMITLHAAALETCGSAIVLLGQSGAGKSTTTALLSSMQNWRILCDDSTILWDCAPTLVGSTTTSVCVWQRSLEGLGLDPTRCEPMPAYDGKFSFTPPGATTPDPVPLSAFVFLSREEGLQAPFITPLTRLEGMATAAQHLVLFNPAARQSEEHFGALKQLAAIVSKTKIVRLSYPSRFDALPAVADLLAELVGT